MRTFGLLLIVMVVCGCASLYEGEADMPAKNRAYVVTKPPVEKPGKLKHAAVGKSITASSTHTGEEGEKAAAALVDGDLQTRWSSAYSEPQQVIIDLGKATTLKKIRLHWEAAAAAKCEVLVSTDGKVWDLVGRKEAKGLGPRLDEFDARKMTATQVKLDLKQRANSEWGFSLYEIEVID